MATTASLISQDPSTPFVHPEDLERTPLNPLEAADDSQRLLYDERSRRWRKGRRATYITIGALALAALALLALITGPIYFHRRSRYTNQPMMSNGTDWFGPTVLLVSVDGFRADYLDRGLTPSLAGIARQGVRAEFMEPSFPSITFPNHYTLITGVRPSHHGIISNSFYDPTTNDTFNYRVPAQSWPSHWWEAADPIWNLMVRSGGRSAVHMWPGSASVIRGLTPTAYDVFEDGWGMARKAHRVLEWLDGNHKAERMGLVCAYIDEVDHAGHSDGPDSTAVNDSLTSVDRFFAELDRGLQQRNLTHIVNVVVVSDHGMTAVRKDTFLYAEDYVQLGVEVDERIHGMPLAYLWPKPGVDIEALHAKLLRSAAASNGTWTVYRRGEFPDRWEFRDSPHIPPLTLVPSIGYLFSASRKYKPNLRGMHGYDNAAAEMRALFVARGPAFVTSNGGVGPKVQNVDVYGLVARLLGLTPEYNDGSGEEWWDSTGMLKAEL